MLAGGGSGVVGLVPEWIRGDVVRRPGWRRAGRARCWQGNFTKARF